MIKKFATRHLIKSEGTGILSYVCHFLLSKKSKIRVLNIFLEKGCIEQFFKYIAKFNMLARSSGARQRLCDVCNWLGAQGHINYAGYHIKKIALAKKNNLCEEQLRFWTTFACYYPENIQQLEKLDIRKSSISELRYALKLLWLSGSNDHKTVVLAQNIIEHFGSQSKPKHSSFSLLAECISILADQAPLDVPKSITKLAKHCENVLPHSMLGSALMGHADNNWLQFATKLKADSECIFDKLTNKASTIAVVGNSPELLNNSLGEEIDSHDIVIRFNKFFITDELVKNTGSKTTLCVVDKNTSHHFFQCGRVNASLLIVGEDLRVYHPSLDDFTALNSNFNEVGNINRQIYIDLAKILQAAPSSGMQIVEAIRRLRGGFEGVSFYGFNFTDQLDAVASSASYGRKCKPSFAHNWHGEKILFNEFRKNNNYAPNIDAQALREKSKLGDIRNFKPTKIKIIGDHSNYHCGSSAVMSYLKSYVQRKAIIVNDDSYDLLIVNGEGSMHHDSQAHTKKMEALEAAIKSGRRGMLINSVWESNSGRFDSTLRDLSLITVRETMSQKELLKNHGVKSYAILDCSYFAKLEEPKVKIDYNNQIVFTDFYSNEVKTFVRTTETADSKQPYLDLRAQDWSSTVRGLKTAKLLVTGRHHAVYAACRAETPFIAFGGNTHKIQGLIEMSNFNIPICNNRAELPALIEWAAQNKNIYIDFFAWMRSQRKFSIPFEMF